MEASHLTGAAAMNSLEVQRDCEVTSPGMPERGSMPMDWTDERHSLYLNSVEPSFVSQLYDSMDLIECFQKESSEDAKPRRFYRKRCSPSGQFKVLREGCWKILKFKRPDIHRNRVIDDSHSHLTSPWIRHFMHPKTIEADVQHTNNLQITTLDGDNVISCPSATDFRPSPPHDSGSCREAAFGGNNSTEVSDQNFVDDNAEGNGKATCDPRSMTTSNEGSSIRDQLPVHGSSRE